MQAWEERYYDRLEAREAGLAVGRAEGELRAVLRMTCKKLRKGLSVQEIVEDLEEAEDVIAAICKVAESCAPKYEEQKVWEEYNKVKLD